MINKEALLRQKQIIKFLRDAEDDLAKARKENNLEGVATYTYLVCEYETMLDEFNEYYRLV